MLIIKSSVCSVNAPFLFCSAQIQVMGGPVKRNMNAYMHFSTMKRKEVQEDIGSKAVVEVSKEIKNRYESLSDREKQQYLDLAKNDKQRFEWMKLLADSFATASRMDADEDRMKELVDGLMALPPNCDGASKWNCVSIFFVAIMRADQRIRVYFLRCGGAAVLVAAFQMCREKLSKGRDQTLEDLCLAALYCTSQLPIGVDTLKKHKDLGQSIKYISRMPEEFKGLKGHAESIMSDWINMSNGNNKKAAPSPMSNRSADATSPTTLQIHNPAAMTPENEAKRNQVINVLTKSLSNTPDIAQDKFPRAARAIE